MRGSVFKKYKKHRKDEYGIYFPKGSDIVNYNKKHDKIIFDWIDELIDAPEIIYLSYLKRKQYNLTDAEIIYFKKVIRRCVVEMVYDKIRSFNNFISTKTIQSLAIIAFIIAIKVVLGYDFVITNDSIRFASSLTGNSWNDEKSVELLKDIEIDILISTGFKTANKVLSRVNLKPSDKFKDKDLIQDDEDSEKWNQLWTSCF